MNTDLIMSFALLFAATIALICAVYLGLYMRKKLDEDNPKKYNN